MQRQNSWSAFLNDLENWCKRGLSQETTKKFPSNDRYKRSRNQQNDFNQEGTSTSKLGRQKNNLYISVDLKNSQEEADEERRKAEMTYNSKKYSGTQTGLGEGALGNFSGALQVTPHSLNLYPLENIQQPSPMILRKNTQGRIFPLVKKKIEFQIRQKSVTKNKDFEQPFAKSFIGTKEVA